MRGYLRPAVKVTANESQSAFAGMTRGKRSQVAKTAQTDAHQGRSVGPWRRRHRRCRRSARRGPQGRSRQSRKKEVALEVVATDTPKRGAPATP